MILYLVSINPAGSLFYNLPVLTLYLILVIFSQFIPKDIAHNPVFFQSTDGVFHYYPLFWNEFCYTLFLLGITLLGFSSFYAAVR